VTFNKKPVKVGDVLQGGGVLETGADSKAKIFVREARTLSILKANSAIEITPSAKTPGSFRLVEGVTRWVIGKVQKDKPIVVTTKTAIMGVRGTEFMASYNGLLGESEIVSFEGTIEFRRKDNPKGKKLVKTGQWGGVGGRFGADVGPIADLTEPILTHFRTLTDLDTEITGAVADPELHGHKVPK
jgi:hypothetical protein